MPRLRNFKIFVAGLALLSSAATAETPYAVKPSGAYYMVDMSSGAVLFAHEADRRILPASMTKMMTAYVVFDLIERKKLSLEDRFIMPPELWRKWNNAGSTMFIQSGQSVSVADLLHGVITLSGNDASALLAYGISGSEAGFTTLMNEQAEAIGLKNSHFANAKGWPDGGKTYSTARDLGTIAERTLLDFPDLYRQFYATRSFRFNGIEQPNRNPILGVVKGADGLKTGHTDEAGYGFTGTAMQDGRRLVMVVAGMPTNGDRVAESVNFLNWAFANTRGRALFRAKDVVGNAAVQGGSSREVTLHTDRNVGATFFKGEDDTIRLAIRYKGPLRAPIAKGDAVATLAITHVKSGATTTIPLFAGEAVGEGNVLHRIRDGFFGLFR